MECPGSSLSERKVDDALLSLLVMRQTGVRLTAGPEQMFLCFQHLVKEDAQGVQYTRQGQQSPPQARGGDAQGGDRDQEVTSAPISAERANAAALPCHQVIGVGLSEF
jgi:hypothetical protein